MIPMFERAKTFLALDCAATVIAPRLYIVTQINVLHIQGEEEEEKLEAEEQEEEEEEEVRIYANKSA
jgi:hypothetical protein